MDQKRLKINVTLKGRCQQQSVVTHTQKLHQITSEARN